ncbi:MAG: hypothetical protein ABSC95_25100 [Acetobacteraceae bacterium]|jgi:hypothetical protein
MSYVPIPDEFVQPEPEKSLALALRVKKATEALLASVPNVAVYGFLLSADPKHPLSKVVSERWSQLHHLTGDKILLVAFDPPKEWAAGIEDYWKQQLGASFKSVWRDWQQGRGVEPGVAYQYLDLFSEPIQPESLPCLVFFTDLTNRQAVVRSIPNWDEDSLFKFLVAQLEAVRACCDTPAPDRLECLRTSLTSPTAIAGTYLGHLATQITDYVRQNPAKVVVASLGLVIALGTGNVLPLGATAITALTAVKDAFSSKA